MSVFLKFTLNTFHSNALFQASCLPFKLWSVSLNKVKSSAQSSSSGHPHLIFLNKASKNMINNKWLKTEPWCNLFWTRKSSMKVTLTLSLLWAFPYINCAIVSNHSFSPSFFKALHTTFLGNWWSKAFSKSTNAKYKIFFFAKCFSCNPLKIKVVFAVPHPSIKPNWTSWMPTCCLVNFSK